MLLRRYHNIETKEEPQEPSPLALLTVVELKELAKDAGIDGYGKMIKANLIQALEAIKVAEVNDEVYENDKPAADEETDKTVGE